MRMFRGMPLKEESLSKRDAEKRRKELLRWRDHLEAIRKGASLGGTKVSRKKRSRKVRGPLVTNVMGMADLHSVKMRKFEGTCVGRSSKRCRNCDPAPRLVRYEGLLGRKHLMCPACGWTDRRLEGGLE
jgi:hypothetical protein